MNVVGPYTLRLVFQGFVVLVGALILSGAVNTAIVGANGVLNRMVEDGVLTTWFKKPQKRFGTSYRVINLIVGLQILTIVASRGNVYLLASLYAFGVIWSFSFMSLAVVVLRYTSPENRRVEGARQSSHQGVEIPVGLGLISLLLFSTAIVNLFTKEMATIAGVSFSLAFFIILTISERMTAARARLRTVGTGAVQHRRRSRAERRGDGSASGQHSGSGSRSPQSVLPAKSPGQDRHHQNRCRGDDLARLSPRALLQRQRVQVDTSEVFKKYEQELFTSVVAVAEKQGKHVSLLVVPTNDVFESIVATAQRLHSSVIVCGLSNKLTADEQGKLTGDAWERLPEPRPRLRLVVFEPDGTKHEYMLGPHTPRMRQEDVDLLHGLWKEVTSDPHYRELHHYHILNVALQEMMSRMHDDGERREDVMQDIYDEMQRKSGDPIPEDDAPSIPPT